MLIYYSGDSMSPRFTFCDMIEGAVLCVAVIGERVLPRVPSPVTCALGVALCGGVTENGEVGRANRRGCLWRVLPRALKRKCFVLTRGW